MAATKGATMNDISTMMETKAGRALLDKLSNNVDVYGKHRKTEVTNLGEPGEADAFASERDLSMPDGYVRGTRGSSSIRRRPAVTRSCFTPWRKPSTSRLEPRAWASSGTRTIASAARTK